MDRAGPAAAVLIRDPQELEYDIDNETLAVPNGRAVRRARLRLLGLFEPWRHRGAIEVGRRTGLGAGLAGGL